MKPSGIGGQAVIEGIMMRNKDQYSIAVRKPDNEIESVAELSDNPGSIQLCGFFSNGNFHNQLFGFVL